MEDVPFLHPTPQTLQAYGLGRLDDSTSAAIDRHLDVCPGCRRLAAEISPDSFLVRLRNADSPLASPGPMVSSATGRADGVMAGRPEAPSATGTLPPGLADHPQYEIVRELGHGGMGTVYLARNRLMGRHEVLKVVRNILVGRPGVLDRFLGEIRNAAKLHHANIVTAYAAHPLGESIIFAMEYIDGLDLARIVQERGPLPPGAAANYGRQAALGLHHAHEHGMVHRDIKPSNLMLTQDSHREIIKILDFGLAKLSSEHRDDGSLTHEGQMLGTPDYVAPEQIRDARHADIRSDIYSLGCTLYHLLSGAPPFRADYVWDVYRAHESTDAKPLNFVRPEVPSELAAAVAKMMAKDPERRFQTPVEVAQTLTALYKDGSGGTTPLAELSVGESESMWGPRTAETPAPTEAPGQYDSVPRPPRPSPLPAVRPLPKTERPIGSARVDAARGGARGAADRPAALAAKPVKLLAQVTCPHCWERFQPEEVLWISEHLDLLGDPRLGPERQQRFLPSRFTLDGNAIDAKGMTCRDLACPRCHLPFPRAMLEIEPLFISILGAPASGKSCFLTAMTWELRQVLTHQFQIAFTDADPASNRALNECEESLFLNPEEHRLVPLGNLIRKTELQGELYDTVAYGQQTVTYPRPFLFSMQPRDGHPGGDPQRNARMLCLYDNAGEHFQPGQDTTASPVTRHLAQSRAIMFVFDPTQDRRFRTACRGSDHRNALERSSRLSRQETILVEAAARIRRHAALAQAAKYERPLVVVVSKFDEWSHLLGIDDDSEPWRRLGHTDAVDLERIENRSNQVRDILLQFSPEIVTAAESFARDVTYIAVSSLGPAAQVDPRSGLLSIRPRDVRPYWAAVPLVYSISRTMPALVPRMIRRAKPG